MIDILHEKLVPLRDVPSLPFIPSRRQGASAMTVESLIDTPSELTELGFADPYQDALIAAYDAWLGLLDRHPHEAQYAVPLGYKLRCLWTLDLRELFHVIELRSARQSHPSTRRIAMALYRSVCQVHPWLKEMIRVDLGDDALSRGG